LIAMMQTKTAAHLAAAAAFSLLSACATPVAHVASAPDSTRVDHALLQPAGQPQYQMDDLSLFVMPSELDSPAPAFPPGVAAGDVAPVTVCVEAWLDAAGDISRLAPLHGSDGCPGQADAEVASYEDSVMHAMQAWSFSAAAICHFPEHLRAQRERGDCRGREIVLTHVPVRLTYAFTFERHAGKAQVASSRLVGGRGVSSGEPGR
jgi:hypothetical protein